MLNIHDTSVLMIMFLLHLIADYTLQGCLANLKQAKWWDSQIPIGMPERERYKIFQKYKNDYKVGLACHSLYWSLIVCLPLLTFNGIAYMVSSIIHAVIHYVIDDMKANKRVINLIQDQALHAIQIACIFSTWLVLK